MHVRNQYEGNAIWAGLIVLAPIFLVVAALVSNPQVTILLVLSVPLAVVGLTVYLHYRRSRPKV